MTYKLWPVGDLLELFMAEQCERNHAKEVWAKLCRTGN